METRSTSSGNPLQWKLVSFQIYRAEAAGILSPTGGFIAQAGFTHSLSPARNCTFGCTYCYVPTMRIYGGLKPDDWNHWGRFTTFKNNAPELLRRSLRAGRRIYCSPLVDPYQPAEETERMMPRLLDELIARPPRVFALQTRGPLILRDLERLQQLAARTVLRVSFSITTDDDSVRRLYEPHCAPIAERLRTVRRLRAAGIQTYATLAPLLPCDPEALVDLALDATDRDIIADPFHVRAVKKCGATTREAGVRVSRARGFTEWHDPAFQAAAVQKMRQRALAAGRRFATGTRAFAWLAETDHDGNGNCKRSIGTIGN
ncbi:MAG TPA: radical SAM protein [Bryobacteraceae bacterium]|nr:radical SAM protein [Bryobacteraceae bacterium]